VLLPDLSLLLLLLPQAPTPTASRAAVTPTASIRRMIAPSAIDLSSICTRALTLYTLAGAR
jgi:hypothetical protein